MELSPTRLEQSRLPPLQDGRRKLLALDEVLKGQDKTRQAASISCLGAELAMDSFKEDCLH